MILIFVDETSSRSMLLLMGRHLVFRFFYDKMGDFSEADLCISLQNEGCDYNEHFQTYKFYFAMRMTFVNEGDSLIFVADLLNAYGESLEGVFERVFHMCIGGVNLQHFNRNHLVDSDYLQFNIEHSDFTDYVYSSRNVKYSELNYVVLVGGVTNWLNNLAQSNRQMDINHDWSLSLQVSSMMNIHRGFGDPPTVDMDGDFLPEVVREGGGQSCSIAIPPLMEHFIQMHYRVIVKRNVHYLVISQIMMMMILRRIPLLMMTTTTLMKIMVCVKFCKMMQH